MQKGIYCIENKINLKVYIGQTKNLKTRFNSHLSLLRQNKHQNKHLQSSYNKYGEINFSFTVLESCENLNERECYWIEIFTSVNNKKGYNKTHGGDSGIRSEETKGKISSWQKGRKLTATHIANILKGNTGRKHSQETKDYMRKLYKGRPLTEETKKKISYAKKGKKLSAETRLKLKGRGNRPVIQYDIKGDFIKEFESAKLAGETLGLWKSDITQCCIGNRKTVNKFIFKHKNNDEQN